MTDWCILAPPDLLVCQRCGETHRIAMPLPISEFTDRIDAFIALHKSCVVGGECYGFTADMKPCDHSGVYCPGWPAGQQRESA